MVVTVIIILLSVKIENRTGTKYSQAFKNYQINYTLRAQGPKGLRAVAQIDKGPKAKLDHNIQPVSSSNDPCSLSATFFKISLINYRIASDKEKANRFISKIRN